MTRISKDHKGCFSFSQNFTLSFPVVPGENSISARDGKAQTFQAQSGLNVVLEEQEDGRPAPEYFLPEYKYSDQHLRTVKNATIV